jgi:hypothetical protein
MCGWRCIVGQFRGGVSVQSMRRLQSPMLAIACSMRIAAFARAYMRSIYERRGTRALLRVALRATPA